MSKNKSEAVDLPVYLIADRADKPVALVEAKSLPIARKYWFEHTFTIKEPGPRDLAAALKAGMPIISVDGSDDEGQPS
jgi:hypothetical protein